MFCIAKFEFPAIVVPIVGKPVELKHNLFEENKIDVHLLLSRLTYTVKYNEKFVIKFLRVNFLSENFRHSCSSSRYEMSVIIRQAADSFYTSHHRDEAHDVGYGYYNIAMQLS